MKSAIFRRFGPENEVLEIEESELGRPGAGLVKVKILASPLNPSDVLSVRGQYGMLPELPAVGGNEGSGEVMEVGEGVEGFKPGDLVLLPIGAGTWRQQTIQPAKLLTPLPKGADPQQMAMLLVNPPSAWLMLEKFVDLQPGEWVIQNAANSAVGAHVIALAKKRGLRTVNIVRRVESVPALKAQGADLVLVEGPGLAKQVREATNKAPIRLALDAVSGDATLTLADCLAPGGTVVNYGALSGHAAKMTPQHLIFRNLTLKGFWLTNWLGSTSSADRKAFYGNLAALVASGELHAPIAATYGIDQIREAATAALTGGRDGKILLLPNG